MIKIVVNIEDVNYVKVIFVIFNLLQFVFNGLCLLNVVVRFLEDVFFGCVFELEEFYCDLELFWSVLNYVMFNKFS